MSAGAAAPRLVPSPFGRGGRFHSRRAMDEPGLGRHPREYKATRATTARTAPGRTRVVEVVLFGSRAYKHGVHGIVHESICTQCNILK